MREDRQGRYFGGESWYPTANCRVAGLHQIYVLGRGHDEGGSRTRDGRERVHRAASLP